MPPPAAPAVLLTDRAGVQQVMGRAGIDKRVNVSQTGVVSAAEEATLTFCLNYATDTVLGYANNQFSVASLAENWMVYTWASVIAAHLLCKYRLGAVPASLEAEYLSVTELLERVYVGKFRPGGLRALSGAGASFANIRLNPEYRTKQVRVEQSISDMTPGPYPVRRDYRAAVIDPLQPDW